jgi:hypothetical protein
MAREILSRGSGQSLSQRLIWPSIPFANARNATSALIGSTMSFLRSLQFVTTTCLDIALGGAHKLVGTPKQIINSHARLRVRRHLPVDTRADGVRAALTGCGTGGRRHLSFCKAATKAATMALFFQLKASFPFTTGASPDGDALRKKISDHAEELFAQSQEAFSNIVVFSHVLPVSLIFGLAAGGLE